MEKNDIILFSLYYPVYPKPTEYLRISKLLQAKYSLTP